MEITGIGSAQALDEFRRRMESEPRGKLAEPDLNLVALLVTGVSADGPELDGLIAGGLTRDWTVDRLEAVLRAILRAGAFELKSRPQTPARVAITEYVDVTTPLFRPRGLVNAVMDRGPRPAAGRIPRRRRLSRAVTVPR